MKNYPTADYPVRVRPAAWDLADPSYAPCYDGIFEVSLNHTVEISFIPDAGAFAPPWTGHPVPPDIERVSSPVQARLVTALFATYVVTPHETLAGTRETAELPDGRLVVFYVTPAAYAHFRADLDRLSEVVGGLHPDRTVSSLRDFDVIRFLERDVVASGALAPDDADLLRAPSAR